MSPGAATLPDGTAGNAAPGLLVLKGTATAPAPYRLRLRFDAVTEQWCTFGGLRVPADYASAPVAYVQFQMDTATTGSVVWGVQVAAVTPGDAVTVAAKPFAAVNTATVTVPGTAGYVGEATIPLTNNDGMAAGDELVFRLARVAADAADTAAGFAYVSAFAVAYTTS
jgi:hypothetical protein